MDSEHFQALKEILIEELSNSNLKEKLRIFEKETIYESKIKRTIKAKGRVNKKNEMDTRCLEEQLFDAISDKVDPEFATNHLKQVYEVEVGLALNDEPGVLDVLDLEGNKTQLVHS